MSTEHNPRGVLFVMPWFPHQIGGVNSIVNGLRHQLEQETNYSSALLIGKSRNSIYVPDDELGNVNFIPMTPPIIPTMPWRSRISFWINTIYQAASYYDLFHSKNIRVVNVHYPTLGAIAFVRLRRLGVLKAALVVSIHGTDIRLAQKSTPAELESWHELMSAADAIIACSSALAAEMVCWMPETKNKVLAIRNGIDASLVESQRDTTFLLPESLRNRRYLISVAAFEARKGLDNLIHAFSLLQRDHPELSLVLIGQRGPEYQDLRDLIVSLGLTEKCHLLTDIPPGQVTRFLESAELFVLPSRQEPFGLVILEAGLQALPVVVSAVGGIPEIISSPELGIAIPPDDVIALRRAVHSLLADRTHAKNLGINLSHRVQSEFSFQRVTHEYCQVFEKLMQMK